MAGVVSAGQVKTLNFPNNSNIRGWNVYGSLILKTTSTTATGAAQDVHVYSGGSLTLGRGMILGYDGYSNTIDSGATLNALSGSVIENTKIDANFDLYSGVVIGSGNSFSGNVDIHEGAVWNNAVESGAVLTLHNQATLTNGAVSSGAQLVVSSGGIVATDITVFGGGKAELFDGSTMSGTITLSGAGGSVTSTTQSDGSIDYTVDTTKGAQLVLSGSSITNTTISGFKSGDSIDLAGLQKSSIKTVDVEENSVIFTLFDGNTKTLNLAGAKAAGYSLKTDNDGDLLYEVCFLPGSMIQTPNGDVSVENIQIGDEVIAYFENATHIRKVIWVGKSSTTVRPYLADDEAGYPVRILKNAISDGVPYKDMLVTAEHSLFFMGRFVPARMLVNGKNIIYDKSFTTYSYYHVETTQHSVICVDGVLTESYLDTGNRVSFQQTGMVVTLGRRPAKSWDHDAAAPLCVDRAFVEPLFHMICDRQDAVSEHIFSVDKKETTNNPNLHLVTDSGLTLNPVRRNMQHYSFMLPPNTQSVRIVSRASRPSDIIGPFVDDRRNMGVAITDINLLSANRTHDIKTHLQASKPPGWHDEGSDYAWTDGNAFLPLDGYINKGDMAILSLTIKAAGPYIIENQDIAKKKAHLL